MHIRRADREHMELAEMDFLCGQLVQQVVPCAQATDEPEVQRRLFSSPTADREPDFEQDWKSYVQPDLRSLFRSTQEIVEGDLKRFNPEESGDSSTLRIPVKNLEAWIHTLNQARLAISARFDFTDKEMERPLSLGGDARGLALFQVHFYGFLQECFLQQLEEP